MKKVISLVLVMTLFLSFNFSALAANNGTINSEGLVISLEELNYYIAEFEALTPEEQENELIKHLAEQLNVSIEEAHYQIEAQTIIHEYMYINEQGFLVLDTEKAIIEAPEYEEQILLAQKEFELFMREDIRFTQVNGVVTFAACEGVNDFTDSFFQEEVQVDSCITQSIIRALNLASVAIGIAGIITAAVGNVPAGLALGVASYLVSAGSSEVQYAAYSGCGIKVHRWLGIFPWKLESQC